MLYTTATHPESEEQGGMLQAAEDYPVPEGPYGKLPYIYLTYLAAGMLWFLLRGRSVQGQLGDS
jgi:hypothetical protein